MPISLISDTEYHAQALTSLYTGGYMPMLVSGHTEHKGGNPGKVWLQQHRAPGDIDWRSGKRPDLELLLDALNHNPGSGLSIYSNSFQDPSAHPVILDVDTVEPAILDEIRTLLPEGMPGWRGRNAGSLIGRSLLPYDFKQIVQQCDPADSLAKPSMLKFAGPLGSLVTAEGKPAKIDLLSQHPAHAVLPPTLHLAASVAAGHDIFYQDLPDCPRIVDTPVASLPAIEPWHMLSLHQYAKNSASPFMTLVREMGPGNFHSIMNDACFYLMHEGWPSEFIEQTILFHMKRIPDFDSTDRRRELTVSLMGAKSKIKEAKPSASRGAARISPDAEILMWLEEQYPADDLAMIGATFCFWDGAHWVDLNGPHDTGVDYAYLFSIAQTVHNTQKLGNVIAAAKGFISKYKMSAPRVEPPAVIAFANGVFDPYTNKFRPEAKEDYITSRLAHPWSPGPTPMYDDFLWTLMRPPSAIDHTPDCQAKAVQLINEWYGHAMLPTPISAKSLFVFGKAGVGKSEITDLTDRVLPAKWISRVPASELGDPNSIRHFDRVRLNTSSEMLNFGSKQRNNFLSITGGDNVNMKTLYQDRVASKPTARLMFYGNLMAKIEDVAGEGDRRVRILRVTDTPPANPIRGLSAYMAQSEGAQIVTKWAVSLATMLARGEFDQPDYAKEALQEAMAEGSAFNAWMDERIELLTPDEPNAKGTPLGPMYADYTEWCQTNGFQHPGTSITFSDRLKAKGFKANSTTIGGREAPKRARAYRMRIKEVEGY